MAQEEKSNRGDIWAEIGDAFVIGQAPHLGQGYECPCGNDAGVKVLGLLKEMDVLVDVAVQCDYCKQIYTVLIPKSKYRAIKGN